MSCGLSTDIWKKEKIQNVKFNWVIFFFLWLQLNPFLMNTILCIFCLGVFIDFLGSFCPMLYYVLWILNFVCLHCHLDLLKKKKKSIVSLSKYTLKCLRIESCSFGGKLKKGGAEGTGTKGCPSSLGIGLFCP